MVSLLLALCFFLTSAVWAHDNRPQDCEVHLSTPVVRTYRFLRKLQIEADAKFPADKFNRIGAGRAISPLVAAIQQAGQRIDSLPLRLNLYTLPWGEDRTRLFQLLKTYLPPKEVLESKPLIVFLYDEKHVNTMYLLPMLADYFATAGIEVPYVQVRLYTSQFYARDLEQTLTKSTFGARGDKPPEVSLRPVAHANEVRHLFHDGMVSPPLHDLSQYPLVDIYNPDTKIPLVKAGERTTFKNLKALLMSPQLN